MLIVWLFVGEMASGCDGTSGMMAVMDEPMYDVVWPKSALEVQARSLADRLDGLAGKRVAFLWDYVFRGDELFPVLADQLTALAPDIEILDYDVFGNTHGGDEREMVAALPAVLHERGVDAVVSGIGC